LALYILVYQLAYNMESITWWALGLPWISRALIGNISLSGIVPFLIFSLIVVWLIFSWLWLLKKSYFYKMLTGWWENEIVLKSLGVKINLYKFTMILITSFLAVVGGNIFAFYYLYIDPSSFWIGMLMIILVISFISYKFNDWWTLLTSVIIILIYEYLRFFKVVDPSKIGYFREIFFGVLIVVVAFVVFRKTSFGRDS
jgi:branched-chain amino acid transport system permease protein